VTPRWKFMLASGFIFALLAAAIYFPILRRRVKRAAKLQAARAKNKHGANWLNP